MSEVLTATLQDKVSDAIAKNAPRVQELMTQFEYEQDNLKDYVVPFADEEVNASSVFNIDRYGEDEIPRLEFTNSVTNSITVSDQALIQIGQKFNIPTDYLNKMVRSGEAWKEDTIQHVLNKHMENYKKRCLIRTVAGEMRAFLSDRYKRFNSRKIMMELMTGMTRCNMQVYDFYYNNSKYWLTTINPEIIDVNGEGMCLGMSYSNSDFGTGSAQFKLFMLKAVCANGMLADTKLRKVHLSAKISDQDYISQNTINLQTDAHTSEIKDFLNWFMQPERFEEQKQIIIGASVKAITQKESVVILSSMNVKKEDQENIKNLLIENDPEKGIEGPLTLWKLAQATSFAAHGYDDTRKYDLMEVAGTIVTQ